MRQRTLYFEQRTEEETKYKKYVSLPAFLLLYHFSSPHLRMYQWKEFYANSHVNLYIRYVAHQPEA